MTFFRYIFSTLMALGAVVFAVANMQSADLFYSPLHAPLELPVSVIALSAAALGFFFGGLFIWCIHGPLSKKADKKRGQVYDLIKENKKLQEESEAHASVASNTALIASK